MNFNTLFFFWCDCFSFEFEKFVKGYIEDADKRVKPFKLNILLSVRPVALLAVVSCGYLAGLQWLLLIFFCCCWKTIVFLSLSVEHFKMFKKKTRKKKSSNYEKTLFAAFTFEGSLFFGCMVVGAHQKKKLLLFIYFLKIGLHIFVKKK
ncbi:hypothetical protein RFI_39155 [Reticulomyxa filosa]|uniref:Uncharacterized protein n=1 Tax=Reticulomyxa filosa TaxID=46433 RepID=X6LCA1_RETFI|nr:hypothetical protein RFI_39155 [Reticulomyxa filosa]|eukprot:ETN98354.1 hypothetical protein RFI_39155 [Reticulomyxa filosa]